MIFTNMHMHFTRCCIYFYRYYNIMLLVLCLHSTFEGLLDMILKQYGKNVTLCKYLFCMQIRKMDNNYSAFFQRGGFVSEPAILVKYNDDTSQVWSMEKLDLKLIDMRELYDELKSLDENAKALFSNFTKELRGNVFLQGVVHKLRWQVLGFWH